MTKRLTGQRSGMAVAERGGTRYEDCPEWVPQAVDRCVLAGLVPQPATVIWHLRRTSTRWGTCWPTEGRIHIYPWAGHRVEVDDELHVDVSGELVDARISSRVVPGEQERPDLEDTLAHELAHLVYGPHDGAHAALTERLLAVIRTTGM